MLENRPEDALGTLVKLVRCCKIRRIARTVQNISHFVVRYPNKMRYLKNVFRTVHTVQKSHTEQAMRFLQWTVLFTAEEQSNRVVSLVSFTRNKN